MNNVPVDKFVAQFLALLGTPQINPLIHADDEMFLYILTGRPNWEEATCQYLRTGKEIFDAVNEVVEWRFGGFQHVRSFLDFACGYGRSTRFLVNCLTPERVWASDISAAAVHFQEDQFHVHGFRSAADPDDLACDHRFDCIFVMSLFTHLPERTFIPWLRKLYSLINEGGVLMFTVQDESLNPSLKIPPGGVWFKEESEIDTISKRDYGNSVVGETFVRMAIEQATHGRGRYLRVQRAVNTYQDMYIVMNGIPPELPDLNYGWGPVGHLEVCNRATSNLLNVSGWTGDITPNRKIQEIQILIDGEMMQRCLPFAARPDVAAVLDNPRLAMSGFSCYCRIPECASDSSTLSVNVVSETGLNSVLYHDRLGVVRG